MYENKTNQKENHHENIILPKCNEIKLKKINNYQIKSTTVSSCVWS